MNTLCNNCGQVWADTKESCGDCGSNNVMHHTEPGVSSAVSEISSLRDQLAKCQERLKTLDAINKNVPKLIIRASEAEHKLNVCEDNRLEYTNQLLTQLTTCQQERDQAKGRLAEAVELVKELRDDNLSYRQKRIDAFLKGETSGVTSVNSSKFEEEYYTRRFAAQQSKEPTK